MSVHMDGHTFTVLTGHKARFKADCIWMELMDFANDLPDFVLNLSLFLAGCHQLNLPGFCLTDCLTAFLWI